MSKEIGKPNGRLIIGGPARANLLPPEVGEAARGKLLRRNAIALIVVAIILVVVGFTGAMIMAISAQQGLNEANAHTEELIAKQATYSEVRGLISLLQTAEAARIAGTSTEIDWKDYLDQIQALLPAGTIVTNVAAQSATPLTAFPQPSVPLQGDRIGELTFSATSSSLPDVEAWLRSLETLTGFVDAAPGSVTLQGDGTYQVSVTMHISKDAFLLRFDDATKEARDKAKADKDAKAGVTPKTKPTPTPTPTETPVETPSEMPTPSPSDSNDIGGDANDE